MDGLSIVDERFYIEKVRGDSLAGKVRGVVESRRW